MKKFIKDFIIEDSKSDKIEYHGYHRFYPWFLAHMKSEVVNLLEVGIENTESLKLWSSYFDKLNLHGIDIEEKSFEDSSVTLHKVDQSNTDELEKFAKTVNIQFDVIVDDGSHVPDHQMLTLENLWKLVKPGGIYIIEDIETSYWGESKIYGYKFDANKTSILRPFVELIDVINTHVSKRTTTNRYMKDIAAEIEMVTFAQNCIILVKKDFENFSTFYKQNYRFENHINNQYKKSFPKQVFRKLKSFLARP